MGVTSTRNVSKPSNEAKITSFKFLQVNNSQYLAEDMIGVIDGTDIYVTVPTQTNITNLSAIIEWSEGASISPVNGIARDYSTPQIYQVTSQSSTVINSYKVIVKREEVETPSLEITLESPDGYTDTIIYLDGIPYEGKKSGNKLSVMAKTNDLTNAIMYEYNAGGVPIGMTVWELNYYNNKYNVTKIEGLTNLLTYHGFSIRITGRSGIRFKTGISNQVKKQLIESNISGYQLKEYGTIVIKNENRDRYPMIKDGEKTKSGSSYSIDSTGRVEDLIFETIDGRTRYTSVLVGLPVDQYKVEYAFRGYIILTKNNKDIILYGPPVARSIYNLAERLLATGQYPEGTSANNFMKELIVAADALR